ncbi:MAG: hypothetical protein Q4G49_13470 [Paracoccus sp. (in: a-proteobacteria)]|nr:hypothetical protein [Paracoccus sp. (in: a-proteobacteria)]
MTALAFLHDLIRAGVEFETDGERIRWRNAGGRMTPEVIGLLRADKARVIEALTYSPDLPPHIAAAVVAAFEDYSATDNPHDERAWR